MFYIFKTIDLDQILYKVYRMQGRIQLEKVILYITYYLLLYKINTVMTRDDVIPGTGQSIYEYYFMGRIAAIKSAHNFQYYLDVAAL